MEPAEVGEEAGADIKKGQKTFFAWYKPIHRWKTYQLE